AGEVLGTQGSVAPAQGKGSREAGPAGDVYNGQPFSTPPATGFSGAPPSRGMVTCPPEIGPGPCSTQFGTTLKLSDSRSRVSKVSSRSCPDRVFFTRCPLQAEPPRFRYRPRRCRGLRLLMPVLASPCIRP